MLNDATHSAAQASASLIRVAPFFISSFVWNAALGMTFILIPLYARSLGMSGVQIGSLISLPIVVHIGFSLIGGALADRLGGRNLCIMACAITAIAALCFLAADDFASMLAIQFLMVIARSTFWTGNLALVTLLPGDPGRQMGRFTIATNGGQIAGSTIAGYAVALSGYAAGFAIMAGAGMIALLFTIIYRPAATAARKAGVSAFATYRQLLGSRPILYSMYGAYLSALPIALLFSFYPILLTQQGLHPDLAGLLIALRGIGAIAAGFFLGRFMNDVEHVRLPLLSSLAMAALVALTAVSTQPLVIGVFMFLLGVATAVVTAYVYTLIRHISSQETRGSAMALFNVGFGISLLTTPALMGVMKDHIGIQSAFIIIGGFTLLCSLLLAPLHRWAMRPD
ncbi:Predicted arabinose efflux permease, MFS family [Noviherbaspirillum humi]|uniref:Predicted arabinose efflux permease, MFS family n=1 Tax=Noviherbaspirillum humi TaxID=1688639 RepID=A0A239F540_9BURK|nr:MFS transporter [Noviherbaspirillum humi]SNS51945.1 Predicted arabinose efflux permease, MFS family [Noviherbaspirillum humi]